MTTRVNLWASPRSLSTAVMYAFRSRADTRVVDEPLYGHYLSRVDAGHPGRAEVLASMEHDAEVVIADQILGVNDHPIVFFKQMAHHLIDSVPLDFLDVTRNVVLTRDPAAVVVSLADTMGPPTIDDVGTVRLAELFDDLCARGRPPAVVDAGELLRDPACVLGQLCRALDIDWDPAMLSWPPGPKPEDGSWGQYWYRSLHASTGFGPYRPPPEVVAPELAPVVAEARSSYDRLMGHAFRATPP